MYKILISILLFVTVAYAATSAIQASKLTLKGTTDQTLASISQSKNNGGSTHVLNIQDDRGFGGANTGTAINVVKNTASSTAGKLINLATNAGTQFTVTDTGKAGIGTASPGTTLQVTSAGSPVITLNSTTAASDSAIELGTGSTGNRNAIIDLTGDDTYTDYGFRIIRNAGGPNTTTNLFHRGTGTFDIYTLEAAQLHLGTNSLSRFTVGTDGRIFPEAIHNNAGGCSGTGSEICSGTYTPVATCVLSASTCASDVIPYSRVGKIVTIGIYFFAQITSNTLFNVNLSLPIASDFTTIVDGTGSVSTQDATTSSITCAANTIDNRVACSGYANSSGILSFRGTFTYVVK